MTEHRMPNGSTSNFIYTLIVYKPSGADYCRNCLMATFNSEFAYESGDRATIADLLADYKTRGITPRSPAWELTVLMNGRFVEGECNTGDWIDEFDDPELYAEKALWYEASGLALKRQEDAIASKREKDRLAEEQKKKVEAEKKANAEKLKELAELARLSEKYKVV